MITHYCLVLLWVQNDFGPYKSFWLSTIFLDWSNFFWSKFFWTSPNYYKIVQKWFGLTRTIWTVQNHFGPIKGQGIHQLLLELTHRTTFAISIRLLIIFYYFGVGILKTKKNWKIEWKIERKADFLSKLWKMKKILPPPTPH